MTSGDKTRTKPEPLCWACGGPQLQAMERGGYRCVDCGTTVYGVRGGSTLELVPSEPKAKTRRTRRGKS